ncbi:MAG: tetraacyldisaccharide 4'-kinase [Candidatus Eisenbacteria bacterium]|nr:tetraacyldisaccharide 4'-kinase [Candidatus Eisenbacteria bacterium]
MLRSALEYLEENEDSRLVRDVASPLLVLSWCYGLAMDCRWFVQEMRPSVGVPCTVISVGNLTVGGTGKTPLVTWLARYFRRRNLAVAVVGHGYGSRGGSRFVLLRGARPSRELARKAGDETVLLSRALGTIPVASGRRKAETLLRLWRDLRPRVVLVDDAFQTIGMRRDLDVVVVDAVNPWGRGYLLPRGRLRERRENLSRADVVVVTRCNEAADVPAVLSQVRGLTDAPVVAAEHVPDAVSRVDTWETLPAGSLAGKNVYAFSGIGSPSSFERALVEMGAVVVGARRFGDHHFFSPADVERVEDAASKLGAEYLATTEKDAVRLPRGIRTTTPGGIVAVGVGIRIRAGGDALERAVLGAVYGHRTGETRWKA